MITKKKTSKEIMKLVYLTEAKQVKLSIFTIKCEAELILVRVYTIGQ
jgi:hypothetical protein